MGDAQVYDAQAQAAQQAMNQNGWGGGIGALLGGIGGFLANKRQGQSNEAMTEAQNKLKLMEKSYAQWEQEQAAAAEQAKVANQIAALTPHYGEEGARAIVIGGVNPKDLQPEQTTLMKNAMAAGYDPKTPEGQSFIRQQMMKSNAPTVNVNNGEKLSPMQDTLGKKNAEKYIDWENQAYAANETLAGLQQLREISQLQKTGKVEEAKALVGQLFGTEAGANMQAFGSVASSLVLQQAEKLKGAMSDGDIKLLEATMPQFGNDPRANEVIFGILERAAQRSIKRFEDADAYFQQNGKLQGFKSEFQYSRNEPKQQSIQPTQSLNPSQMSDDDLLAEILKGQ